MTSIQTGVVKLLHNKELVLLRSLIAITDILKTVKEYISVTITIPYLLQNIYR